MSGNFISFEGPDGAGKTSVIKALVNELQPSMGDQLVVTREPGGDPFSAKLRKILFDDANKGMDGRTEALLFAADRRHHVVSTIMPALATGKTIFCDRYVDSSVAYQGGGRQLGEQEVWDINAFATNGVMPQLTVYFEIAPEVGIARIETHRTNQVNRLDEETMNFHHRVHAAYQRLCQQYPERITVIDASQPLATVIDETKRVIHERFPELFAAQTKGAD